MAYEVKKQIEYGTIIFSVIDTETGCRVNYFNNPDDAKAFADKQEQARIKRLNK